MKQPWLKFYSSDWRGDVTLGPCSLAARGLWMEMLCIMSEAEPRGSLVKGGKAYTMKQLAALARAPVDEVEKLIEELETEGVFSRDPDGTIYSRRIRRDIEREARDKTNGGKGGNPSLKPRSNQGVNPEVNPPVNPKVNGEDKAQKLEARSQSPEARSSLREDRASECDALRDRFCQAYPNHSQPSALDAISRELERRLADGESGDDIVAGAKRYAASMVGKEPRFVMAPLRWLSEGNWKSAPKAVAASIDHGIRVEKDAPNGRAWTQHMIATTGKPPKWILNHQATYFPTEWPPDPPTKGGAEKVHEAAA